LQFSVVETVVICKQTEVAMKSNTKRMVNVLLVVASFAAGGQALAQPGQMMSNEDMQNIMQNRGGGGPGYGNWGMGPGMMGMGGYGPGMMGGGYGQGMMGGMGMGMMGMGGMGMGMMGMGGMGSMMLDLNDEQQKKADAIHDDLHKRNWALMGKMRDESRNLRDLYRASPRDAKKIGAVYAKIFDLKRQMIESMIDAQNRQEALLTKEQKEQLQQWRGHMPWYQ